ncbi:hypothetical protein [Alkalicoccobacillus gibsonii]|uniref:hypothetical protein n=1 Tax=Alkalicoccobacillus gibsonii TaxID=79881 RepID=UPI0019327800|nr:hypothetical protein [Alkalicoccobacillus gibsonii]MBM0066281.1 hypothetical protein [Alkalicoccobacillus gibsonii]
MNTAIIFGVAIFLGWMILDVVKYRTINAATVVTSVIAGVVGAIFWYLLDRFF